MSNPILVNDNLVNITSMLDTDGWKTYDISAYLNHPDPKMVVIMIMNNPFGTQKYVGCKPTGSTLIDGQTQVNITRGDLYQFPCSLAGGTTIDIWKPVSTANTNFYIHAEIGGDDAVIYDDPVLVNVGTALGWKTVDATARVGADVGLVKAPILMIHFANNSSFGYRSFGSTDPWLGASIAACNTFAICGIDRLNRYQIYMSTSAGKSPVVDCWYWEAGYLKGQGWNQIDSPVDRNLNVAATWTDEDLTDITEGLAEMALIRYSNLGGAAAKQAWMRTYGAIFQGPLWIQQVTHRHCLVNLTAEQVYQYYIQDAGVDQFIMGWYAPPGQVLTVDKGVLSIDRGTLTVG